MNHQPLFIELIGPAGSGKTTLARLLVQSGDKVFIAPKPRFLSIKNFTFSVKNFITLLPVLFKQRLGNRLLTYREIKWMLFLNGWDRVLWQQAPGQSSLNLLDHGPVYMLTSLLEFGPDITRSSIFQLWWGRMLDKWTSFLDLVIWLDAPNAVLAARINNRDTSHQVKGEEDEKIYAFLSRYRNAFEHVFSMVHAPADKFKILHFQTDCETTDQIKEKILELSKTRFSGQDVQNN